MGLTKRMVALMLEKDSQGRDIFFPFGRLDRGRIIPDGTSLARLKKFFYWNALFLSSFCIVSSVIYAVYFSDSEYFFIFQLFMVFIDMFFIWILVRRYPISESRPSGPIFSVRKMSETLRAPFMSFGLIFSLLMLWATTALLIDDPERGGLLISYSCFYLFLQRYSMLGGCGLE